MTNETIIRQFLEKNGWGGAESESLANGYSARRYMRLRKRNETAVLMMADTTQKTDAFVALSFFLRDMEIPAPEIYAHDLSENLVLMQDFGDVTVGAWIDRGGDATSFDEESAMLLARLHERFDEKKPNGMSLPEWNGKHLIGAAESFLDHYAPARLGRAVRQDERAEYARLWQEALFFAEESPKTLLLRDFMPDNVMMLKKPMFGVNSGFLDFQDAGIGPVAYDVGTWCEGVRREDRLERLDAFVDLYVKFRPDAHAAELKTQTRLLMIQHHMRCLGIFTKYGKKDIVVRTEKALSFLLSSGIAPTVRAWLDKIGIAA